MEGESLNGAPKSLYWLDTTALGVHKILDRYIIQPPEMLPYRVKYTQIYPPGRVFSLFNQQLDP